MLPIALSCLFKELILSLKWLKNNPEWSVWNNYRQEYLQNCENIFQYNMTWNLLRSITTNSDENVDGAEKIIVEQTYKVCKKCTIYSLCCIICCVIHLWTFSEYSSFIKLTTNQTIYSKHHVKSLTPTLQVRKWKQ